MGLCVETQNASLIRLLTRWILSQAGGPTIQGGCFPAGSSWMLASGRPEPPWPRPMHNLMDDFSSLGFCIF